MATRHPLLSVTTSLGIAAAMLISACSLITRNRIQEVVDCEGQLDGTPCGADIDDGVTRVCMNDVCVTAGGSGGGDGGMGGGDGGVGCDDPPCEEPLDTMILSAPSDPSGPDVVFQFAATRDGATFECRLDAGIFEPCTSPASYTGLGDGPHTFAVRATVGPETDATPAEHAWTVDVTKPDTTITSGPDAVTTGSATFTFTGNLAVSFECRLDPYDIDWMPCTSPVAYDDLVEVANPGYRFQVRAVNEEGVRDDTPADQWFKVDRTGPSIVIAGSPLDDEVTNLTRTNLTFAPQPHENDVTYECAFDTPTFSECDSVFAIDGLVEGEHLLKVRAIDRLGNVGPVAEHNFTIEPLATTIVNIRTAPVAEHTRVSVAGTTNAQFFITYSLDDRFFAQIGQFGAAAHNGITVYPISWSANQGTSGRIISVIGTVRQVDGNTALVDATVSFSGSSIPQTIPAVQMDSTRNLEHYEGMVVVATGLYSASGGPAPCTGRVAPCNQSWQLCYVGTAGHSTYLRQYFGVIEGVGSGHVFRRFDTQSYGSGYVECD